jgi:hypothetical protein
LPLQQQVVFFLNTTGAQGELTFILGSGRTRLELIFVYGSGWTRLVKALAATIFPSVLTKSITPSTKKVSTVPAHSWLSSIQDIDE